MKHKVTGLREKALEEAGLLSLQKVFFGKEEFARDMGKVEKFLEKIDKQSQDIFKT